MRVLKFLMFVGLILAVSGTVGAVGIPFRQSYGGGLIMHISNWAEGTVYSGLLADGSTPATPNTRYLPSALEKTAGAGAMPGEDGWGIFKIDDIRDAYDNGPNTMSGGPTILYVDGDAGINFVGIYSGRVDTGVVFDGVGGQTIYANSDVFNFYTQPVGSVTAWGTGMAGPNARTALGNYPGIGFDAADAALPGAELVWVGAAQPGFLVGDGFAVAGDAFVAHFKPVGASGSGDFTEYVSFTGGTQLAMFDTDHFPNVFAPAPVPPTVTADLAVTGHDYVNVLPTSDPWLVYSSDPSYLAIIPEPITMFGCFLGIGALGRYLGKRVRSRN